MSRDARRSVGFSLLELIAAVAIIGILTSVAVSRFGTGTLANTSSQTFARRLALDLHRARRAAISTGDDHFVEFSYAAGVCTGYVVKKDDGGSGIAVDEVHSAPTDVLITPSTTQFNFTFEGTASGSYTATLAGTNRSWTVSVTPLTGAVSVSEDP